MATETGKESAPPARAAALSALRGAASQKSVAWLWVFLPALGYYMATRLVSWGLFRSSSVGTVVEGVAVVAFGPDCSRLPQGLLYARSSETKSASSSYSSSLRVCDTEYSLSRPLYKVQDAASFSSSPSSEPVAIVATAWKHDEELGRGYLLVSTANGPGKIWQWETGGGPIPIGRTLHLKESGCRSGLKQNCSSSPLAGSGGIAVDAWHEPPRLLVAEWGEERVSRLEPESGARTPLILDYSATESVHQPTRLLLTAFGDLLVVDTERNGNQTVLWQLPQTPRIPPLASLSESRAAHAWTSLPNHNTTTHLPNEVLRQDAIGGVALVPNHWMRIYVSMRASPDSPVVLASLSLAEEEEEDDDDDAEEEETPKIPKEPQSELLLDYGAFASEPGFLEVDDKGTLYLAVDDGILLVQPPSKIMGYISIPGMEKRIVSMTLGEDRFLYIATVDSLYRMKVRNGPMKVPNNLVLKG